MRAALEKGRSDPNVRERAATASARSRTGVPRPYMTGENHPRWRGGHWKTDRKTPEYRQWRREVMERDNWTCQECKVRGGYLHAHHLFEWAAYHDRRFDVANGLTLCASCHMRRHRGRRVTRSV